MILSNRVSTLSKDKKFFILLIASCPSWGPSHFLFNM